MHSNEIENQSVNAKETTQEKEITSENVDYVKGVLERTLTMIANCDNKISIMLGILGVMLVIFVEHDSMTVLKTAWSNSLVGKAWVLAHFVGIFVLLAGMCCLSAALYARTNKNKEISSANTFEYYTYIFTEKQEDMTAKETTLSNEFKNLKYEKRYNDLVSQLMINYQVLSRKYSYYNTGLTVSLIGAITKIITYIVIAMLWGSTAA